MTAWHMQAWGNGGTIGQRRSIRKKRLDSNARDNSDRWKRQIKVRRHVTSQWTQETCLYSERGPPVFCRSTTSPTMICPPVNTAASLSFMKCHGHWSILFWISLWKKKINLVILNIIIIMHADGNVLPKLSFNSFVFCVRRTFSNFL